MSTTEGQIQGRVNRLMTAWDADDADTVNEVLNQPGGEEVGRLAVKGLFSDGDLGNGIGLNTFLGPTPTPPRVTGPGPSLREAFDANS